MSKTQAELPVIQGNGFTAVNVGAVETWERFVFRKPGLPVIHKQFLCEDLGSRGLEMSLNSFGPGEGMNFLHRHKLNEEIYVVLSGSGEFWIDGQIVPVSAGTILRIDPPAARGARNTGTETMAVIVLQYRAASEIEGTIMDGELVSPSVTWEEGTRVG